MGVTLILGSGPSAAGVALALTAAQQDHVIMYDLGVELESELAAARRRLGALDEADWDTTDVELLSPLPHVDPDGSLPEKRTCGSDYPFRNEGQLAGLTSAGQANSNVISSALGGYSNVWGAQAMPFTARTFDDWPIDHREMRPHYDAIAAEMSISGDHDDLEALFPLPDTVSPLPPLAHRCRDIMRRYDQYRSELQLRGITVGKARLAFRSDQCTRCGMCMTGCPYDLIYSSAWTVQRLRDSGAIDYRPGYLAIRLCEDQAGPFALLRERNGDRTERIRADRIYVACGGVGTTRLVMSSRGITTPIRFLESAQIIYPFLSLHASNDPWNERRFTLNQVNILWDASGDGRDVAHLHLYPYNALLEEALPSVLRSPRFGRVSRAMLSRITVGFGYLPSWASPGFHLRPTGSARSDGLLPVAIEPTEHQSPPPMMQGLNRALLRAAPRLDLWPVLPRAVVSPVAKSYHFGGSFAHSEVMSELKTDRVGRLSGWNRIHLVDGSVFPSISSTTFTFTVMANAHRIATETITPPRPEGR